MGRIPTKRGLAMLVMLFVLSITIGSAQKVNLNFSQKSLRTVLESITEQTSHTLAFSKEAVDLSEAVTIRITDGELEQVLNQLLTPRHIGYEIRDNKIYIFDQPTAVKDETGQTPPQEVHLTGTVTDQNGEPIIGANIVVPGTTIGTVTNMDGRYSISLPQGSMLRISYSGYLEQEFRITNQTLLNVQLAEDVETL
ncbi:MAG: carboxypeptidase-like regulatory domain-containing protein, partial [Candidatus Pacebacteria bacterium]|nr:carboxypeptidase-like regulatory domain-containing protein [Candidatus Paceibacterota bacterium]